MQIKHLLALGVDIRGAQQYINILNRAKTTAKLFGIQTSESAKLVNIKQSQLFKKGKLDATKYTATLVDGNKRIATSFKDTGTSTQFLSAGVRRVKENVKRTVPITQQLVKALKRVAIVVPVWLLFRTALMQVLRTLSEGFRYWVEFDKAIEKSRQVIHGFTGDLDVAVDVLTNRIKQLSIETGLSMAKLSSVFYRFGTVGLDFETSMQGMEVATRLANVMFGNADQTAKILAKTYRLLGESIDTAVPPQKRMAIIGAQIAELWKTNAFELDEFTGALEKFLPTANVFNFTVTETNALLATLQTGALRGSRAGRLLRTSINKLVNNLDQVASTLGIHVNPAMDSTFDVLMNVLGAVKKLSETGDELPIEAIQAMGIFGGVRSREAGLALVAMYDLLQENLEAINLGQGKYNQLLKDLESRNDRILKQTFKQVERFDNLRKLIGKAFVEGLVGAEDFADAMGRINKWMEYSISGFYKFGDAIEAGFIRGISPILGMIDTIKRLDRERDRAMKKAIESSDRFRKGLAGALEEAELKTLIQDIENFREEFTTPVFGRDIFETMGLRRGAVLDALEKMLRDMKKKVKEEEIFEDIGGVEYRVEGGKLLRALTSEVESQLKLQEQELKYLDLRNQGVNESVIAEEKLKDLISEKVRLFNAGNKVQEGQLDALDEQEIIALALKGDYEALNGLMFNFFDASKDVLAIEKLRQQIVTETVSEAKQATELLVQNELDLLKLRGATATETAIATIALKEQFGLYKDSNDILKDQLSLEKEITKEMLGQNDLSSESIKLWKIAQRYGTNVAQEIGAVISGISDISQLSRTAGRIFEREFTGRWEQFQAQRFFAGRGAGIPIPEARGIDLGAIAEDIEKFREQYISTEISAQMKADINVNIDSEDINRKVLDAIQEKLKDPSSNLSKLIKDAIDRF